MILDMGPMESLLAVGVTLLLVVGIIYGGVYAYRLLVHSPHEPSTSLAEGSPKTSGIDEKPPISHTGPSTLPKLPDLPAETESVKAKLIGHWVSRADDGSVSSFEFRAEGTAMFRDIARAESDGEPIEGRWAVTGVDGDVVTVAIYYAVSGLTMHRMTIEIASPECINVLESAFRGAVQKWDQRFIREPSPAPRP